MMKLKQKIDIVLIKSTTNRGRLSENSWQGIVFWNITFDNELDKIDAEEIREVLDRGSAAESAPNEYARSDKQAIKNDIQYEPQNT